MPHWSRNNITFCISLYTGFKIIIYRREILQMMKEGAMHKIHDTVLNSLRDRKITVEKKARRKHYNLSGMKWNNYF